MNTDNTDEGIADFRLPIADLRNYLKPDDEMRIVDHKVSNIACGQIKSAIANRKSAIPLSVFICGL